VGDGVGLDVGTSVGAAVGKSLQYLTLINGKYAAWLLLVYPTVFASIKLSTVKASSIVKGI